MSAPTADAITSAELHKQLESSTAPRSVDVRTPAEFETSHIPGSYNVPLDVLDEHSTEIAKLLDGDQEAVLVCRSGQRSAKAQKLLQKAGLTRARVLENGILIAVQPRRNVECRDGSVPVGQPLKAAQRLGRSGWPYTATTTVRSILLSDHTPMAVLAQSRMIAMSSGL